MSGVALHVLLVLLLLIATLIPPLHSNAVNSVATDSGTKKGYKGLYVIVVYHAFANHKNDHWEEMFEGQLMSVKQSGLLDIANEFHVALTTGANKSEELSQRATNLIHNRIDPHAIVNATFGNYYEYNGISQVYRSAVAAKDRKNTVITYLHSKGGFNVPGDVYKGRSASNIMLTRIITEDWKFYLDQFIANPVLNVAGLANTCGGAAMYENFWWARASYLAVKEEPKFGDIERHYYEFWLNTGSREQDQNKNSILSICSVKYLFLPTPQPPECDKLIDDHHHGTESGMNNMKYAILCNDSIMAMLKIKEWIKEQYQKDQTAK